MPYPDALINKKGPRPLTDEQAEANLRAAEADRKWSDMPDIQTLRPIAIQVRRFSSARGEIQQYAESYTRFLQAKRDFPELNHIGHEPRCECLPSVGMAIRDRIERDFYREA